MSDGRNSKQESFISPRNSWNQEPRDPRSPLPQASLLLPCFPFHSRCSPASSLLEMLHYHSHSPGSKVKTCSSEMPLFLSRPCFWNSKRKKQLTVAGDTVTLCRVANAQEPGGTWASWELLVIVDCIMEFSFKKRPLCSYLKGQVSTLQCGKMSLTYSSVEKASYRIYSMKIHPRVFTCLGRIYSALMYDEFWGNGVSVNFLLSVSYIWHTNTYICIWILRV